MTERSVAQLAVNENSSERREQGFKELAETNRIMGMMVPVELEIFGATSVSCRPFRCRTSD